MTFRHVKLGIGFLCSLLVFLFVLNGLFLAPRNRAVTGTLKDHPGTVRERPGQVTVMAWNLAKAFAYQGELRFKSTAAVQEHLDKVAAVISAQNPDVVFLSEVMRESGTCRVDQVTYLAGQTGLKHWAYGENFNLGFPGLRASSGNAILSRFPLTGEVNMDLAGRNSFIVTYNNRRALFCRSHIEGRDIVLVAVHNDSFNLKNNLEQVRQIIVRINDRPALLAGDFNARWEDPPLRTIENTAHFSGKFKGPGTVPSDLPKRCIDFIFAPKDWSLYDHRVPESTLSDHRPVVSVFKLP